jgi:hypothetical protein
MAACISGTFIMHLFASGFFNGLVLMVTLVINSYLELLLFGYQVPQSMNEIIKSALPIFGFRNGLDPVTTVVYISVIVLMTILAYLINKIRAIEKTGDSLVFGWTKMLMIGGVTFLGAGLFGLFLNIVFSNPKGFNLVMLVGILFGFIVSFTVVSLIVVGSRNIISRESIKAAVITAVLIVLCLGIPAADVTGYSAKTPDKKDVEYAYVKTVTAPLMAKEHTQAELFNTEYKNVNINGMFEFNSEEESMLKLKDKNNIAEACKIQKIIVDRKNAIISVDEDDQDSVGSYASVFCQNGSLMKRGYDLIDSKTTKMMKPHLKKIFESDEYKSAFALSNLKYSIGSINYKYADYEGGAEDKDVMIPKSKIKELIAALDKDFAGITYEQYLEANDSYDMQEYQHMFDINLKMKKDDEALKKEYIIGEYDVMTIFVSDDYKNTFKWIKDNIK